MSVLDQIVEMKNKGMKEDEIVNNLKEQGVSPREILDALNQAKIKDAVNSEEASEDGEQLMPSIMRPEPAEPLPTEGDISDEDLLPPKPTPTTPARSKVIRKELAEEPWPAPPVNQTEDQNNQQAPESQEGYYEQQQAPQYGYYYEQPASSGMSMDTDTLIEISEQVFAEKIKTFQKQLESLNEFKALSEAKIDNTSERLKRLESGIDDLQSAVLEKIGSYGRGIDSIKSEMELMQDSFGKITDFIAGKKQASKTKEKKEAGEEQTEQETEKAEKKRRQSKTWIR